MTLQGFAPPLWRPGRDNAVYPDRDFPVIEGIVCAPAPNGGWDGATGLRIFEKGFLQSLYTRTSYPVSGLPETRRWGILSGLTDPGKMPGVSGLK